MSTFTPMLAEVGDKEPALLSVWCVAAVFCILSLGFSWVHRWGTIIATIIAAFSGLITYGWLYDPHAGPAIRRELGMSYFWQAAVAGFLPFLFIPLGLIFRRDRRESS